VQDCEACGVSVDGVSAYLEGNAPNSSYKRFAVLCTACEVHSGLVNPKLSTGFSTSTSQMGI
jgi:hypothetical protein